MVFCSKDRTNEREGISMMRKTKIICTLGPAVDNDEAIKALVEAGMDVARFNFSHGTHEEAKVRIDRIKRIREELDIPVAILLDTKGPEVRIKTFKDGKVTLVEGQTFTLCTDDVMSFAKPGFNYISRFGKRHPPRLPHTYRRRSYRA